LDNFPIGEKNEKFKRKNECQVKMINLNMQMINRRKNMLDAFLYEKNGFEIWINVVEYGKNAS
jgi:hypothetical protein